MAIFQHRKKSKKSNKAIGLIDADLLDKGTRHPNLALLKIAGYYRDLDYEVHLIKSYEQDINTEKYEQIYLSKVFTFSKIPDKIEKLMKSGIVQFGGTGFYEDGGENLPTEIEHHKPYYNLYDEYVFEKISMGHSRMIYSDYLDYSIGFTTRGCFRKCSFCVNKKYDGAFIHSPISEFIDYSRPYIYLWDDNILSFNDWDSVFYELNKTGKPFQFRQGLDLRLIDDHKAFVINNSHYRGDVIFAFDNIRDKAVIIKNLQLWKRHTNKICKLYVLCAFNSQDLRDIKSVFERIKILMQYGSLPYIMRFEKYKESKFRSLYIQIARWCNQPNLFKKMSFREFCIANQNYKSNQETNCSTLQTMLDFEKEFPEVSAEYFDLKFSEENMFDRQYGFGRRFAHKSHCGFCKNNGLCWTELCLNNRDEEILSLYFTKQIDLQCLLYPNAECKSEINNIKSHLLNTIKQVEFFELTGIVKRAANKEPLLIENSHPLASKIEYVIELVNTISKHESLFISIMELNDIINKVKNISIENIKEICKMACLLDLTVMFQENRIQKVGLSVLGRDFIKLSKNEKNLVLNKLFLRVPYVQHLLDNDKEFKKFYEGEKCFADSSFKQSLINYFKKAKYL